MLPEALRESAVARAIEGLDGSIIIDGSAELRELALEVRPESIVGVCTLLRQQLQFERLSGLTCVDWYPSEPRFQVVYLLHSIARNDRVRLLVRLNGEAPEVESVTGVWRAANYYEREVYDLFGVRFRNHPDLTRIMLPDDWEGHPLRKDYPIHGTRYSYKDE